MIGRDIGSEDVLDGPLHPAGRTGPSTSDEPDRVARHERTRLRRPRDYAAALAVVVLAVAGVVAVAASSDERATASRLASAPIPSPAPPDTFPPSLGEAWRADSPATPDPVTAGPAVVTAAGSEVQGRDAVTGEVLWSYRRDLPLCTVTGAWSQAVAVYRNVKGWLPPDVPRGDGGCSEVTALDGATGRRGPQRNSDAELGTRLISDGTYVTTTGTRLLTTWRSDLVLTMEYGQVPDLVNAGRQPRAGCVYSSVAATPGRIGVIERCPDAASDRLTVYKSTAKDSDNPDVELSIELGSTRARVLALTGELTAVAVPGPARVLVFDPKGAQVGEYPMAVDDADLATPPAGQVVPVARSAAAIYWFTGSDTVALSPTDLSPQWTKQTTLGAGTVFGGRLLVPVADGLDVLDPVTGESVGVIGVDRGDHRGPVTTSSIGTVVLEQRGDTLVALT